MAKKPANQDRQARIDAMRRQQQGAERRRTLLVMGAAGLAVLVLVSVVVVVVQRELRNAPPSELTAIGVAPAAASCDPITEDLAEGVNNHVGPGTPSPDVTQVDYDTVPPSAGPHFVAPEFPAQPFYTADDRPPMENLVHNLEHGYTIIWYTDEVPEAQLEELRVISDIARDDAQRTGGKFIVSAWDTSYGEFPEDKTVALSHWAVENGHRQLCGAVSGQVVDDFVEAYPFTDSPEPNAP